MIIKSVLKYLVEEINEFYSTIPNGNQEDFAVLGNVARLEGTTSANNAELQKKVIVTLVNISEETSLKNNSHYIVRESGTQKRNPTMYLNLYVLISCADDDYENGLHKISNIISFFQRKYVFIAENTSIAFPSSDVDKIILDLHSLSFEQMNHLWGILGGKYYPSALYRLRLLPVQASDGQDGPEIVEIKTTENAN
jgi:hypothetical protein